MITNTPSHEGSQVQRTVSQPTTTKDAPNRSSPACHVSRTHQHHCWRERRSNPAGVGASPRVAQGASTGSKVNVSAHATKTSSRTTTYSSKAEGEQRQRI